MASSSNADEFTGAIPEIYQRLLVPLIFEPYALHLANRLASLPLRDVLEVAAGTGVVTRQLAAVLPENVSIVATDLHHPMLEIASALRTSRHVEWRQADALDLPFETGTFDAVVCQFGVMFFGDRPAAYAESRRVLRPGGVFIFSVWDRIEENEFADTVTTALEALFREDPPRFLARIPHGYHDPSIIERDLKEGGFAALPEISTVANRSRADSPRDPAIAYCLGTPLRAEIEARDSRRIEEATEFAGQAVADRFGTGTVGGKIQAHILTIRKT
jgi:SAM-dependent methyltransferase